MFIRAKSFHAWGRGWGGGGAAEVTCARGGVWLPEVTAADLGADDSVGALQEVAWIALEGHVIAWLPAVPAAGPVGRHARVVAGGRRGDCGRGGGEMTEAQTLHDCVCVCVLYAGECLGVVTRAALLSDV